MSAKKQTSGKTTKKSTTGRKTTSAKSGSKTHSNPQPNQPLLSPRVRAILFGLAATLFFGLIFIKGATGWMAIRSFFFGLLGICIFLVPIVFIYLCIITEKEKQVAHLKAKVIMCILLVLFVSAFTAALRAICATLLVFIVILISFVYSMIYISFLLEVLFCFVFLTC